VLVDTGPIVAMLSEADQYHERCLIELANLQPPLLTCWPVITEVHWLLRQDPRAVDGMFRAFATGLLKLMPLDEKAIPWLEQFLRRYRKLGAQIADAALVYLAERDKITTVFTLDRRDFSVYRFGKNRSLELIPQV
jgi:predicted nucleic acid-binding protein